MAQDRSVAFRLRKTTITEEVLRGFEKTVEALRKVKQPTSEPARQLTIASQSIRSALSPWADLRPPEAGRAIQEMILSSLIRSMTHT
jgi:hypothetical protein